MKRNALIKLAFPVLLVSFSISWAIQCHAQGALFVPSSPVAVGQGSGEIVLADLNRDGHLDMLTKHLLPQNVTIRLGDGKGHFAPIADSPMSFDYQPGTITLGDVNNDGILDMGVASKDKDREYVRIFLGNGKGAFSLASGSPLIVSAATETYKPILRFGDVNEDGKADIVMGNGRRNTIEVLYGDGRGGFIIGQVVKLEAGENRHYFDIGDIDGDRHLDIVLAIHTAEESAPGRFVVRRGDGKGVFIEVSGSSLSVPPGARLGTLADVNGDKHLDAVLSHTNNHLSVLLNSGKGMFTPAPASPYNIGTEAFAVVVADVNADKKNDLVAATVNSVTVLLGDGRKFAPAPGSPFRAGPGAYNVTVGDLNEDGKLDVAASSFEGNAVTVLLGR